MNKGGLPCGVLRAFFIDVVDTEEGTGEGGGFAEGYQERGVDFSLRVDEDAAEEEDEAAGRKDKGGYQLQINSHNKINFLARWHDLFSKFCANMPTFLRFLLVNFTNRCYGGWFFAKICRIDSSLIPNRSPNST